MRQCFVFPSHLSSGSALPCKTGNPEIASFHLTLYVALPTNTQNTFKLSPGRCWITLHSQVIDCMHQTIKTYLERPHSILLSVTHTLYMYQVYHGVERCVKDRSYSSSSLEWKLMDSITISTNVRHTNTSEMTFFSFRKTAHWCTGNVCATHSNCCGNLDFLSPESWVKKIEEIKERLVEFWQCNDIAFEWKMQFSCITILPGSAEVHVIWGGTVKHLLTAYFIGNIPAKKYQNVFTCQS